MISQAIGGTNRNASAALRLTISEIGAAAITP
jgi:hypothetical protein